MWEEFSYFYSLMGESADIATSAKGHKGKLAQSSPSRGHWVGYGILSP